MKTAKNLAIQAMEDALFCQKLHRERGRLGEEIALDPDGGKEITSGTVNGESFGATIVMSKQQRYEMLCLAIRMAETKNIPGNRSRVLF